MHRIRGSTLRGMKRHCIIGEIESGGGGCPCAKPEHTTPAVTRRRKAR